MSEQNLKPLKTWSYLSGQRRRPSEYEIVSAGLHFSTDNPACPWEQDPNIFMNRWFREHREMSPLRHENWNGFRDPDEVVYRTYNIMQDSHENYVDGLLKEFDDLDQDKGLSSDWVLRLLALYTPARYVFHALQMGSAYLAQMAPASTITNCATFQAADSLRWLSHIAYRTKQLDLAWPGQGFGVRERDIWENAPHWQGFRELTERALIAYDWGEAFVAINLILKPAVDEAIVRQLAHTARNHGDTFLALLLDAQLADAERSRRWSGALVKFALQNEDNAEVLNDWVMKWLPLGDAAIKRYCAHMPEAPSAADDAMREAWAFRSSLGLAG